MSRTAPSSRAPSETVFVDGVTGFYHHAATDAGTEPARYSRAQADLAGYEPCPTCFSARSTGGERDG